MAVDLRREQVVDAVARRALRGLRRRGACPTTRSAAVIVRHFEDRVDLEIFVGVDRLAGLRVDRQCGRVRAAICGWAVISRMLPGQARETLTGVERSRVLVVRRVVDDFTAGRLAVARGRPRGQHRVAVLVVVVDAGRARVAAGDLGGHAGERVGRDRRLRRAYSAPPPTSFASSEPGWLPTYHSTSDWCRPSTETSSTWAIECSRGVAQWSPGGCAKTAAAGIQVR